MEVYCDTPAGQGRRRGGSPGKQGRLQPRAALQELPATANLLPVEHEPLGSSSKPTATKKRKGLQPASQAAQHGAAFPRQDYRALLQLFASDDFQEQLGGLMFEQRLAELLRTPAGSGPEDPNDRYLVQLWVLYIRAASQPLEVIAEMQARRIGRETTLFYQMYAELLEQAGDVVRCDDIFMQGIKRQAQPLSELIDSYAAFKQRVMLRPQAVAAPVASVAGPVMTHQFSQPQPQLPLANSSGDRPGYLPETICGLRGEEISFEEFRAMCMARREELELQRQTALEAQQMQQLQQRQQQQLQPFVVAEDDSEDEDSEEGDHDEDGDEDEEVIIYANADEVVDCEDQEEEYDEFEIPQQMSSAHDHQQPANQRPSAQQYQQQQQAAGNPRKNARKNRFSMSSAATTDLANFHGFLANADVQPDPDDAGADDDDDGDDGTSGLVFAARDPTRAVGGGRPHVSEPTVSTRAALRDVMAMFADSPQVTESFPPTAVAVAMPPMAAAPAPIRVLADDEGEEDEDTSSVVAPLPLPLQARHNDGSNDRQRRRRSMVKFDAGSLTRELEVARPKPIPPQPDDPEDEVLRVSPVKFNIYDDTECTEDVGLHHPYQQQHNVRPVSLRFPSDDQRQQQQQQQQQQHYQSESEPEQRLQPQQQLRSLPSLPSPAVGLRPRDQPVKGSLRALRQVHEAAQSPALAPAGGGDSKLQVYVDDDEEDEEGGHAENQVDDAHNQHHAVAATGGFAVFVDENEGEDAVHENDTSLHAGHEHEHRLEESSWGAGSPEFTLEDSVSKDAREEEMLLRQQQPFLGEARGLGVGFGLDPILETSREGCNSSRMSGGNSMNSPQQAGDLASASPLRLQAMLGPSGPSDKSMMMMPLQEADEEGGEEFLRMDNLGGLLQQVEEEEHKLNRSLAVSSSSISSSAAVEAVELQPQPQHHHHRQPQQQLPQQQHHLSSSSPSSLIDDDPLSLADALGQLAGVVKPLNWQQREVLLRHLDIPNQLPRREGTFFDISARPAPFSLEGLLEGAEAEIELGRRCLQVEARADEFWVLDANQQTASFEVTDLEADSESSGMLTLHVDVGHHRLWELYVGQLIAQRVAAAGAESHQFLLPAELHLCRDYSVLVCPRAEAGTLATLARAYQGTGGAMPETLVLYYSVEMLRALEALHATGVSHCALTAACFALREANASSGAPECEWAPHLPQAWRQRGLALRNFQNALDTALFPDCEYEPLPELLQLAGIAGPSCRLLAQMGWQDGWQLDAMATAGIIHGLLAPRTRLNLVQQGELVQLRERLEGFEFDQVWTAVLHMLLNGTHSLEEVRHHLEEALASNPKNRKSLGMLLCQQNLLCLKDS